MGAGSTAGMAILIGILAYPTLVAAGHAWRRWQRWRRERRARKVLGY